MKILVAEDSKEIVKILELFLKREGHEIKVAWDGKEAYSYFQDGSFDLIITDYRMPEIDGLELLRLIRKENTSIPIVLISADKSFEKRENSSLSTYIIKKPFSFTEIDRIITEIESNLASVIP